jgi:peptidoglycan/LPS O-acetylase OafA/YrhL
MDHREGTSATQRNARFRPEIQALRAVAVALVIAFHLWPQRVTGGYVGVDVFFVISGYLITSHLLRERRSTGRIGLSQFYARRIRRLLPAALLVLLVTAVTVIIAVPTTLWRQFLGEVAASAVYVVNWVLAANAVDYFAADNVASPVQHYWSLSVEEQFYLVWPLLIIAVFALTRSLSWTASSRWVAVLFGLVIAGGLAFSVIGSRAAQAPTYFATPAHAWEFAAGGLVAVAGMLGVSGRILDRIPTGVLAAGSWIGFAGIIYSAFRFDADTLFPGYVALLPVVATLLVIAAGVPSGRFSPRWIVRSRPVQLLGDLSYSAYLWHWPLIVLVPFVIGAQLTLATKLAILAATLVLAWLSKRYVEDGIRTSPAWARRSRTFLAAALASVLLIAVSTAPIIAIDAQATSVRTYVDSEVAKDDACFGAAALPSGLDCEYLTTVNPEIGDDPALYASQWAPDGCPLVYEDIVRECVTGDDDAEHTIAFIGDSHMAHYRPAVFPLLDDHDWQYRFIVRGACAAVNLDWSPSAPDAPEATEGCETWRSTMIDYVANVIDVDLVVVSNYTSKYFVNESAENREQMAAAYAATWKTWTDAGIAVLVVGDAPATQRTDVPTCVQEHLDNLDACAMPVGEAIGHDPLLLGAAEYPNPLVTTLDHSNAFCDDSRCYAVAGGVVAYADKHHIAPAFAASLAPRFESSIEAALATVGK